MLIVITLPEMHPGEAAEIVRLLRSGVDLMHIRKPHASAVATERLILEIPEEYRSRLVLHDHHQLAVRHHLHGVHLNSRNPLPPDGWKGSVSRSCHSLEEVEAWKGRCDYVSLSPIFDSISKPGYHAAFSRQDIGEAHDKGIIDAKVMALGGVTFDRMDEVLRMGFGGGMILGDAWHALTDGLLSPSALSIAGSDPSAGAGIQQDLKTMHALGVYCATVTTALTVQNTMGVKCSESVSAQLVARQLDAVLTDLRITAIKIGMVPNAEVAEAIAQQLTSYVRLNPACKVVLDPIMVSTSGRRLMDESCIETVARRLFPLCTLVTPNLPEAQVLRTMLGSRDHGDNGVLAMQYKCAFLVKGGHGDGDILTDRLYLPNGKTTDYSTRRIATHNLHGTGCTLSSAITAFLLQGFPLEEAIGKAREVMNQGIAKGATAHIGHGNGPLIV